MKIIKKNSLANGHKEKGPRCSFSLETISISLARVHSSFVLLSTADGGARNGDPRNTTEERRSSLLTHDAERLKSFSIELFQLFELSTVICMNGLD